MVERERQGLRLTLALGLSAALSVSCSTVDKARPDLPPAGTSPSGAELVADEPQESSFEEEERLPEPDPVFEEAPEEVAAEPQTEKEADSSLVVIDPGANGDSSQSTSLAEAAKAERERRGMAPPSDIVITDKTLADFATGELTVAETTSAAAAAATDLSELESEMAEKEAYWRGRARQIRQEWRDAYDSIEELEAKVFELRQQFYREDDGFYRDAEIKPAWDRAIDQLEEARLEVEAKQLELEEFLEEGREAGALPGWLREGIELEPKPVEEKSDIAKPTEPVIYEPEASDPP